MPLSSLAGAAELVADLLPADTALGGEPLDIDPIAAQALGDWYRFADAVLARLIASAVPVDAATPAVLWPEHFDIATELGDEGAGLRANYGASPGDESHPEPYLYVGPWTAEASGALWQAIGFTGAELGYAELISTPDQGAAALEFFMTRKEDLK